MPSGPLATTCQNCKASFAIEPEDADFYKKIGVPPPTFCPPCRAVRRLLFWNEHQLFKKKEAGTEKQLFSGFPEKAPLTIYAHDRWWSDSWDPMSFGREYDFTKPFFEQFRSLMQEVPWPALAARNMVRSDYCNQAKSFKDCYLCFNGDTGEQCSYGIGFNKMKDCLDFYMVNDCELCYDLFSVSFSYRSFFLAESDRCRNCWFMLNCANCVDCVGCVNLSHKQYYIFNEPYSKEDYFKKLKEMDLSSHKNLMAMKEKFAKFRLKFPMKYAHTEKAVNVIGEYVYLAKNAKYCYQALQLEDVKYSQNIAGGVWESMDYTNWGDDAELMYESVSCGDQCSEVKFCFDCWPACEKMEYSMNCHSSSHLFGCVGLTKKQYCIFNKQYSKSEYAALLKKIKAHMDEMPYVDAQGNEYRYGEFFPAELSPLAYNESSAQDLYPLDAAAAKKAGYAWHEPPKSEFKANLPASELPDRAADADKELVKKVIGCEVCGRRYQILASELEFYVRMGLPLPHQCHHCRFAERIKFRNAPAWYSRTCMCAGAAAANGKYKNTDAHSSHKREEACGAEILTPYAPDRPEIIYCAKCYKAETG
jgi:hypothetical protein